MRKGALIAFRIFYIFYFTCFFSFLHAEEDISPLFRDLSIVDRINLEITDHLPFHYNNTFVGGYWNMPSARMNQLGMAALGFAYVPPYRHYGFTLQMLSRVEVGVNYRVYIGISDPIMGKMGFGDFSDRGANIKFALLKKEDGFPSFLPEIAVGWEDFYGTKRFHSFYGVATYSICDYNLEVTIGFGKGRIKGFFGGISWTPFRQVKIPVLNQVTLLAEWDAIDYANYIHEHPSAKKVESRINGGISLSLFDLIQLNVSTIRGNSLGASAALYYNLGSSKGIFPKVGDPAFYHAPINTEPIGFLRSERELAQELACAFFEQKLNVHRIYLLAGEEKELWIKLVNVRYREEIVLKDRIEKILSALLPSNIRAATVVIEADGIPTHSYYFRRKDLVYYQQGDISEVELEALTPMQAPVFSPSPYESALLYHRNKKIWTVTIRPRLLMFFGSSTGKFKYSFGALAGPEGYLWDQMYYKIQVAYHVLSSTADMGDRDKINPSQLINVRSDMVRYFQKQTVSLEEAYLQQGFYFGRGWYGRMSAGYFEPAYVGAAFEVLCYPVRSNFAFGLEIATVFKRRYQGLGVTTKVRKFNGLTPELVPFIGYQYFLDLYYDFKPMQLEFKASIGQFLARDFGVHFEVGRYYSSGFRFSIWYDWTNAKDIVNGSRYWNKGIAFSIPLDFFLKKSSRSTIGYALAAWLRDTGARAATGKKLYPTLHEERRSFSSSL